MVEALGRYEPGLVEIVKRVLEAQNLKFTHLANGNCLEVSADGRRVTVTSRDFLSDWDDPWAIMTPGAQRHRNGGGSVRCWRVAVHRANGLIYIGVVGTTDRIANEWHQNDVAEHADLIANEWHQNVQPTFHGWGSHGAVYLAGKLNEGHGSWSTSTTQHEWETGDEAALRLDTTAGTLTLKHARFGSAFALADLPDSVAEWFVAVGLLYSGDSIEVQPMSTAAFSAFLA